METYLSSLPCAGSAMALHGLGELPCHAHTAPGTARTDGTKSVMLGCCHTACSVKISQESLCAAYNQGSVQHEIATVLDNLLLCLCYNSLFV